MLFQPLKYIQFSFNFVFSSDTIKRNAVSSSLLTKYWYYSINLFNFCLVPAVAVFSELVFKLRCSSCEQECCRKHLRDKLVEELLISEHSVNEFS